MLKLCLVWVAIPLVLIPICIQLLVMPHQFEFAFPKLLGSIWTTLFSLAGATTLSFALIERFQFKFDLCKFDPRKLPAVPTPSEKEGLSRFGSACELAWHTVVLCWWSGLFPIPTAISLGKNEFTVHLTPMVEYFWAILGILTLNWIMALMKLIKPLWTPALLLVRFSAALATMVVSLLLMKADQWIEIHLTGVRPVGESAAAALQTAAKLQSFSDWFNLILLFIFACVAFAAAMEGLGAARRLVKVRSATFQGSKSLVTG